MMNISYFRFFLGMIIVLFCFIAYSYLKEKIIKLNHLSQLEKKLYLELQDKSHEISVPLLKNNVSSTERSYELVPLKNTDMLLSIIHIIEKNGFVVKTLQPLSSKMMSGVNVLPIKIVITGEISQLSNLLSHLTSDDFLVGVSDLSLSGDENHMVTIEMNMWILCIHSISLPLKKRVENTSSNEWMHAFSINQLKLVGYLHNNHYFFALVMFPNGRTEAVQVGSIIGLENARIVNITENEVVLMLGQQQKQLYFT